MTPINYTPRLNRALILAATAHHKQGQMRKGTDIPYIIHPVGAMVIASGVTNDEDILIACLMHDVLEDVDTMHYDELDLERDFGLRVLSIVKDVTKDKDLLNWRDTAKAYLDHLEHKASTQALVVSAADKLHNLLSIVEDVKIHGRSVEQRFSTKNMDDQIWWYTQVKNVLVKRNAPLSLTIAIDKLLTELKSIL